jgi:hypothetical protein
MSLSKYQKPRTTRFEPRTIAGTFRGGKLAPVMAVPFLQSESGVVSQSVVLELDPIAGRMISQITAEIVSVFVPAQAADALKNPLEDFAGSSEVFRSKLLSGAPVFGLEAESEVSKRLGVVPRSVSGSLYVNEIVRLSHNAAVNHLRQRKNEMKQVIVNMVVKQLLPMAAGALGLWLATALPQVYTSMCSV